MSTRRLTTTATLSFLALLTACGNPVTTAPSNSDPSTSTPTGSTDTASHFENPTPASELGFTDGDVELQIFTAGESDFGPRYELGRQWLEIIETDNLDQWWSTVLPDPTTRTKKIDDVMVKPGEWTTGFAVEPTNLEAAPSRKVVTNEDGHLTMGIKPGPYLVCIIRVGSILDDGRVKPTLVQDCGAVSVTGGHDLDGRGTQRRGRSDEHRV